MEVLVTVIDDVDVTISYIVSDTLPVGVGVFVAVIDIVVLGVRVAEPVTEGDNVIEALLVTEGVPDLVVVVVRETLSLLVAEDVTVGVLVPVWVVVLVSELVTVADLVLVLV